MAGGKITAKKNNYKQGTKRLKNAGSWLLGLGILLGCFLTWLGFSARKKTDRTHYKLQQKFRWYDQWHQNKYHKQTHYSVLAVVILAAIINLTLFHFALASDNFDSWDFSTPGDYSLSDSSAIEISGNSVRLKAQNYTNDGNTSVLFHLDSSNGTSLIDSSSNGNTGTAVGSPSWVIGNLYNALSLNGTNQYATVADSASLSFSQSNTLEGWTKFDSNFGNNTHNQDQTVVDKGSYKLYYDRTTGKVTYELANSGATNWTQQAGNDVKGSWDNNGKAYVLAQVAIGSNIYAALGVGTSDAEVWKWNGSTWSQIGGDGKNSSWADQTYESVASLVADGNTLYAGLGTGAGDAEVWSCDTSSGCSTWTKIGGDGLDPGAPGNASWAAATYETAESMTVLGGYLYVGLGLSAQDGEVWRFNTSNSDWTKIGGDGVNPGGGASWAAAANVEEVYSMVNDGTYVYAGLGSSANDAAVWRFNPGTNAWGQIGGQSCCGSWGVVHEDVLSMTVMGGNLYIGLGTSAGDAEVWKFDGNWTKIGGDGTGWADATYEGVYSLTNDGTNIYAGLGLSSNDNEVWKYNGSSWSKIGGDAVNGGFTNSSTNIIFSLLYTGGNLYAGASTSGTNFSGELWVFNGSSWSRLGGNFLNSSWGVLNYASIEAMASSGNYLYAATRGSYSDTGQVWRFDGSNWELIGGMGLNGGWPAYTYEGVYSLNIYKGELYAGLGLSTNDAEVWKWDGAAWTKIGGDGINSGWSGIQRVSSMTVYNNDLYVGLYGTANNGQVYKWNGSAWTYVGGNTVSGGYNAWPAGYEGVTGLTVVNNKIYAGMAASTGDADIWQLSGTTWTQIGGDDLNSSWASATYEDVDSMVAYNGDLYAGLGSSTGDAEVWKYNGSSWSKIGGDDSGGGTTWTDGQYEQVRSLVVYNGELYAGLANGLGDGEVWKYNGSTWTKSAGGGANSSWAAATVSYVPSMSIFKGKLYAAVGGLSGSNSNPQIWSLGGNGFVQSAATTQDTNWHHIAATYDGTTMKIYIDGTLSNSVNVSLSIPDNSYPLLIGTNYGGSGAGNQQGFLAGSLDEVRISSTVRSSFTTLPYSNIAQVISLAGNFRSEDIKSWDSFNATETANGGSIKYRFSDDGGTTWKYHNGSSWVSSASYSQANTKAEAQAAISTFPVTFSGIRWQAILQGDGTQQVTLNQVNIDSTSDTTDPNANASSITAKKAAAGASLASNSWTNGASPYFDWTGGTDTGGSGIKGYCLYLGQTPSSDPVSTKGLLGISPVSTGGHCQFLVAATSLDLATSGYLATALTTSDTPYYLNIKAIDNAGNVYPTSAQFQFRFDNTAPTNPAYVTAPSGFINTKQANLTWETAGGDAPSDANSGLAGLQYRIGNSGTWYGDSHNGNQDETDMLSNDGLYATQNTPDFSNIIEGINTIYFRTWDNAGNATTSYTTAALKVNTAGAPSSPQNLTPTPSSNTDNSFEFSWDKPSSFVGPADGSTLIYCYTVNAIPTANNCTYTAAGVTSLSAGPFATQPGDNTFYVVAKDESGNINYATYASVTFAANTSAPGAPLNPDAVDASIKATSNWRIALTWEEPSNVGSGVANYKIYRSSNNVNFSVVATTTATSIVDTGLSQHNYYYYVTACDSANNCGIASSTVSKYPTGRFTTSATMTSTPKVSGISTRKATINWSTDRTSDSKIQLGTKPGVYAGDEISNSNQVTAHEVNLANLQAGTTYYFRAKWTDEDGNTGTSPESSFATDPAPNIKEVTTKSIGLSDAVIGFTTKGAVKVKVYYGKSESFGGTTTINTSTSESSYSTELAGLDDGTKYFYKIDAFDSDGNSYEGNIFSLTTPQRPKISDLKFEPVEGEPTSTQKITWLTNVPTDSKITYGVSGTNGQEAASGEMKTDHEMIVRNLTDNSEYFLVAQSRDANGNLATSDRQTFHTALDTRPPKISDFSVESTIRGTGSEARGQLIISWKTDELATSQVAFGEGSSSASATNQTTEDANQTTEHTVVISDLSTAKVYNVVAMSKDKAGNQAKSESQSSIIGRASDSVLSIIFNTLQKIFGFLGK